MDGNSTYRAWRLAISAGEALPAVVFERFKQRFGIEILDGLGSTETLQTVISNRPGEVRPGSTGKVVPGYEAKIVDENGRSVAVGVVGNLMIKGDSVCSGYWNGQEKIEGGFADHWFRTGDRYYQDQDGYFWNAGRTVDTFKVNGRWLNPSEVEGALIAHPSVYQAAVVPREDEVGLTKAAAYVVLAPNVDPSDQLVRELKDWVGQRIGSYKRPKWIEFLSDLPKTATGKVQRFKLRELQVHHDSNSAVEPSETHFVAGALSILPNRLALFQIGVQAFAGILRLHEFPQVKFLGGREALDHIQHEAPSPLLVSSASARARSRT